MAERELHYSDCNRANGGAVCNCMDLAASPGTEAAREERCGTCRGTGWYGAREHRPEFHSPHIHCECGAPCRACPAPAPSPGAPDEVEALAEWMLRHVIQVGITDHEVQVYRDQQNSVWRWALSRAHRLVAVGYLSPAQVAEAQAQAWDACVRECFDLGWMHDFAKSDALARNPYRADRLTRGEGTDG